MQEKVQKENIEQKVKMYYEKPLLSIVRLFANQVLQTCKEDMCTPPDPDMSG